MSSGPLSLNTPDREELVLAPFVPTTMRAVLLIGHGGYEQLKFVTDAPVPRPHPGEVLVRVGASAVNNTDINTRTSWYSNVVTSGITVDGAQSGFDEAAGRSAAWSGAPLRFPRIQGADIVGEVVACGDGVDPGRIGQRVLVDPWIRDPEEPSNSENAAYIGSERDGGFAEYVCVPEQCACRINSTLSDLELASFPCAYSTAENVVHRAQVGDGDTVVITGASGGVGSAAVQLCKRRGARVVAMAGSDKHDALRALGADVALPRSVENLSEALQDATGDAQVDAVLDPVCGDQFGQLIGVLRVGGRYASPGAIAGPIVTFDARDLIYRDLSFFGATCAPREVFDNLIGYIERGEIRPAVTQTYALEDLVAAQKRFLEKTFVGKIVIRVQAETR